jgi:hypothetical protein
MAVTVFREVTPCSVLEVYQSFGGNYYIFRVEEKATQATVKLHVSTLKMEEICSSETSVNFYQITRCLIQHNTHYTDVPKVS